MDNLTQPQKNRKVPNCRECKNRPKCAFLPILIQTQQSLLNTYEAASKSRHLNLDKVFPEEPAVNVMFEHCDRYEKLGIF
jgi:hypothetical protein